MVSGRGTLAVAACAPADAALRWGSRETVAVDVGDPRVALDARGDALAAWANGRSIEYSWRAPRGSWTAPRSVANTDYPRPGVALGPLGDAMLAWVEGTRVIVSSPRVARGAGPDADGPVACHRRRR